MTSDEPIQPGDHIEVRDITNAQAVAIGAGATAVYQGLTYDEVVALLAELKNQDQPTVWNGFIPYLGLNAYQEADARYFFGRESLVEELIQRVQTANFITIAGPSGSGKSSVARAGLFHALREGAKIENSDRWRLASMQPKGNPLEQLALAIERLTGTPGSGDYLRQNSQENPLALHQQAETLLSEDPSQRFVLLVDQFEELFTQTKDATMRQTFINLLTEAAQAEDSRCRILISLRSDFVSNCASHEPLRELMSQQFQLVGAMAPRDLAKAITLPALEVGAEIDPKLVSQIIADMKGSPDALPLMSFALRDLFEVEKSKKGEPMDLTLPEYVQRGGLEKALEEHANKVFNNFTAEQKEIAKNIFSKLIEVGQGRVDTRRTATFAELVPAGSSATAVTTVLSNLADVRLVTTSDLAVIEGQPATTSSQEATVTIAHEKMIDAWPWLKSLIDENREMISLQNQIAYDAQLWNDNAKNRSFLYPPGRALQIQELLSKHKPSLSGESEAFIAANIENIKRRQLQRWVTGGLILAILAIASAYIIITQADNLEVQQQAFNDQATSQAIATLLLVRNAEAEATSTRVLATSESIRATSLAFAQTAQANLVVLESDKVSAEQTRDILFLTANPNAQTTSISSSTSTPNFLATVTAQANELAQLQDAVATISNDTGIVPVLPGLDEQAVVLGVPYRSMWDDDAKLYNSDAGPTILAMLLNRVDISITPDEIYDFLPPKGPGDTVFLSEISNVAAQFGVDMTDTEFDNSDKALRGLIELIDEGKPFMALVKYEPWIELTGNPYSWGHFVLVVGYDENSIYIHDPLFGLWVQRSKGEYFEIPTDLFLDGWGGFSITENPNWTALVPDNPIASRLTQ